MKSLDDLFREHASTCKKGNKCCYSPDNGSTQEFENDLLDWFEEIIGEDVVPATYMGEQGIEDSDYEVGQNDLRAELRSALKKEREK